MLTRLRAFVFAVIVVLGTAGISYAGCDGPNYPPDYPFGQPGTPAHPNGHDGYPAGHPNNPGNHGGPGGDGIDGGDGGCGGNGTNGGSGGTGGQSGPNGGCGGVGGHGGDNPGGTGGSGGTGGVGVDCGGKGGQGGSGTNGGAGGCGGNTTSQGGEGGGGGTGGAAAGGFGGTGGCGGNATGGPGSCGGDAGDGGDATGITGVPGSPGTPGRGSRNSFGIGETCDGDAGKQGDLTINIGGINIDIMPADMSFKAEFLALRTIAEDDIETISLATNGWVDIAGSGIKLGAQRLQTQSINTNNIQTYWCLLHPNSLLGDTVRITLEARVIGTAPILQIDFGADEEFPTVPSVPMPLEDGWMSYQFTIVRPVAGVALGKHLDMFAYSGRDIEVRMFEAHELGKKGDVNLDGSVNILDAAIVLENYSLTGDTTIEDGDTNLDGTVDTVDVLNILEAIGE